MKYKDVVRLLQDDGWIWQRSKGSHNIFKHPLKPGMIVVAYHGAKDLPEGTLRDIYKQAGLKP